METARTTYGALNSQLVDELPVGFIIILVNSDDHFGDYDDNVVSYDDHFAIMMMTGAGKT